MAGWLALNHRRKARETVDHRSQRILTDARAGPGRFVHACNGALVTVYGGEKHALGFNPHEFCGFQVGDNDDLLSNERFRAIKSGNAGHDGADDDSRITFEFYEPTDDSPSPVVLLMPILNGQKHLMRPFATKFANNGYAAVIIDTVQRRTLLDDLGDPEPAIRLTIQRHRRVIDWVETRPDLDASRIAARTG